MISLQGRNKKTFLSNILNKTKDLNNEKYLILLKIDEESAN